MEYKGVAQDKAIMIALDIIREPYTWPGRYEIIAITDDGGVLCHVCVKSELRQIATSYTGDGWHVVRVDIVENFDTTPLYCDHCGKLLNGEKIGSLLAEDGYKQSYIDKTLPDTDIEDERMYTLY